MTVRDLTPERLRDATWEDVLPWYAELVAEPLDRAGVPDWLARWSHLESCLSEAASLALIAYTCDTADAAKEQAHLRFTSEILPRAEEQGVRLARRLVDSGWSSPEMEVPIARFRTAIQIFREANVPLFAELESLSSSYQRITGSMTAEWEGERRPLPMLAPLIQDPDRAVRERAWRAFIAPYQAQQEPLADLFDTMRALRQRAAAHSGFANYRDYSFAAKCRVDYTPGDCEQFHAAVAEVVVPAVGRVMRMRQERLGLDRLRPWDLAVDPWGSAPLRPYRDDADLSRRAAAVFGRVDPELAGWFRLMIDEGLLDLGSREGKAPGGYCDTLHHRGRPFIFMNGSGVLEDVTTLLHEAGHSFHAIASHRWPLIWQRHPSSESAELASMSMELLAGAHLGPPGGFLAEPEVRRARLAHLEDVLLSLTHIASVDAFQTWIYTSPDGADRHARDAEWLRLRDRFETGADWSGLEPERIARWYRQLHIFLYPFYYIEYGIAQLGALQVWRNARQDPAGAAREYREFLALGATRPLPALYRAAGAELVFDRDRMAGLIGLVEEEIGALAAGMPEVASH